MKANKKNLIMILSIFSLNAAFNASFAENENNPPTLNFQVQAKKQEAKPFIKKEKRPTSITTINKKTIMDEAGAGSINVFKAIDLTPSVNAQTQDAYGLGGGQMTLRGFSQDQIGFSLDGLPLNDSGNLAIYPNEYVDLENLETITVKRGAVSAENPFYSDIGGAIKFITRPPSKKHKIDFFPRVGEYGFRKYFVRIDTGYLNKYLPLFFVSYSHTQANKWKGHGENPKYRDHYALGVRQRIKRLSYEFYYDRNIQLDYYYRGLTFAQANDLSKYKYLDYNPNLLPLTSQENATYDSNYYKFHSNPYTNDEFRGNIKFQITKNIYFKSVPYYWRGRGGGTFAYSSGKNLNFGESYNYTDRLGVIPELYIKLPKGNLRLNYWIENSNLKNFQTKQPVIVNNGNFVLSNNGTYGYIEKTITTTNSPSIFFTLNNLFNYFDIEAGLKYAIVHRNFETFNTKNLPFLYDNIYSYIAIATYKKTQIYLMILFTISFCQI